jgi:hypothetical protein
MKTIPFRDMYEATASSILRIAEDQIGSPTKIGEIKRVHVIFLGKNYICHFESGIWRDSNALEALKWQFKRIL